MLRQAAEQSNTSVIIHQQLVLKLFRRLEPGLHPEAEIGRFLSERGYRNTAPLHGEVTRFDADGNPQTLMILQGFIDNQGDAWAWTRATLERAIREAGGYRALEPEPSGEALGYGAIDELKTFAATLGRRLGELHSVLAGPSDDPAFTPEVAGPERVSLWTQRVTARLSEALALLEGHRDEVDEADQPLVDLVLHERDTLEQAITQMAAMAEGSLVTRIHGDLHLGQVLVAHDDAYIIDFEGEPARPLEERRAKDSPLRDVAGMLRSFAYAYAKIEASRPGQEAGEAQAEASHEVTERFLILSRQEFLNAYWQATLELPHEWLRPSGAAAAVDLFVLEKTAYEIAYEAANRPAWLSVPCAAWPPLSSNCRRETPMTDLTASPCATGRYGCRRTTPRRWSAVPTATPSRCSVSMRPTTAPRCCACSCPGRWASMCSIATAARCAATSPRCRCRDCSPPACRMPPPTRCAFAGRRASSSPRTPTASACCWARWTST